MVSFTSLTSLTSLHRRLLPLAMGFSLAAGAAEAPAVAPAPAQGSSPTVFRTIGDRVYFAAATPERGNELYSTDGQPDGLRFVADIAPGAASSNPVAHGFAGQRLIVEAEGPGQSVQLWSVGAGAPTLLTATSIPDGLTQAAFYPIGAMGDRLLLGGAGALWITDGTLAGTKELTADAAFPIHDFQVQACTAGERFVAVGRRDVGSGPLIIVSDGTVAGTVVAASVAGYTPAQTVAPIALDGRCLLPLKGENPGVWYLWESDATVAGTHQVRAGDGWLRAFVRGGDNIYTSATTDTFGFRIDELEPASASLTLVHESSGVHAITRVPPLVTAGDALAFTATRSEAGQSIEAVYLSDGTAAGTQLVYPGDGDAAPYYPLLTALDDGVVLQSNIDSSDPASMWYFDFATASRTAGPGNGFRASLAARLGSRLIGAGTDGLHGTEVWISDGKATGTQLLHVVRTPDVIFADGFGPTTP